MNTDLVFFVSTLVIFEVLKICFIWQNFYKDKGFNKKLFKAFSNHNYYCKETRFFYHEKQLNISKKVIKEGPITTTLYELSIDNDIVASFRFVECSEYNNINSYYSFKKYVASYNEDYKYESIQAMLKEYIEFVKNEKKSIIITCIKKTPTKLNYNRKM